MTFINKMDRDVRPPLELIDEIENGARHGGGAVHLADRHGQAVQRACWIVRTNAGSALLE